MRLFALLFALGACRSASPASPVNDSASPNSLSSPTSLPSTGTPTTPVYDCVEPLVSQGDFHSDAPGVDCGYAHPTIGRCVSGGVALPIRG